jgi:hypothetical protein
MAAEVVRSSPDKDRLRFLAELLVSFEKVEVQAETAASKLLPATIAERDTLLARVNELEPLVARVAELETFKATNDEWRAEQVRALTAESQQNMFKAQRSENQAKDTMESAQRQFSVNGLEVLMDAMRDLIAANNIPEPDIWNLPKNVNPLLLTLWPGWTRIKAQIFVGLTNSYKEPTEGFRQKLLRCLSAGLPVFQGVLPDPIEHREAKLAVMTLMAEHWNIMSDIQQQFEQIQIDRQAAFLRNHYAQMSAQEHDTAQRGMGRTPIGQQEPASSVPLSEHGLNCSCKVCGGPPPASDWNGYIPADSSMSPLPTKREDEER